MANTAGVDLIISGWCGCNMIFGLISTDSKCFHLPQGFTKDSMNVRGRPSAILTHLTHTGNMMLVFGIYLTGGALEVLELLVLLTVLLHTGENWHKVLPAMLPGFPAASWSILLVVVLIIS